jgi:hypothetical protein
MSARRSRRLQDESFSNYCFCLGLLLAVLTFASRAAGQNAGPLQVTSSPQDHTPSQSATALEEVLTEAEHNNPQIAGRGKAAGFIAALLGNILLIAVLVGLWLHYRAGSGPTAARPNAANMQAADYGSGPSQ